MPSSDLPYLLAFLRFPKFGAKRLTRIHTHFENWTTAWRAHQHDLLASGIDPLLIAEFIALRPSISPEAEWERLLKHDLHLVPLGDPTYPALLAQIHDPPIALFVRGTLPPEGMPLLSIVGSRDMTDYARKTIDHLIPELVASGLGIVSGLALGVDGSAHEATVRSGGKTWSVLPGGCDWENLSPSRHRNLASHIIGSGGGLLSEFPIGTTAMKHHFPIRNRLIAGLSQATLVIEASLASGTLITANSALSENREVLCIPGRIDAPLSQGPNRLIREGATIVTSARDILESYHLVPAELPSKHVEPKNADEALVLSALSIETRHVDDLARDTHLPASTLLQTLTALELSDGVVHVGGNRYRKR